MFRVTCHCAAQLGMTSSVSSNGNTTMLCNDTKGESTFPLRPACSPNGSALAAQPHFQCSHQDMPKSILWLNLCSSQL